MTTIVARDKRISDLDAGSAPYDSGSLVELSVPAGGGLFDSKKALLNDIRLPITAVATDGGVYTFNFYQNAGINLSRNNAAKEGILYPRTSNIGFRS